MGKGFNLRKMSFNWVSVAAVFAFLLSGVNTILIKKTKEVNVCTIDVWEISNKKVLELTQEVTGLTQEGQGQNQNALNNANISIQQQQQILDKLNEYLKKVNLKLSNPSDYGCSFIAVKGSIIQSKNVKDITQEIAKDVK